MSGTLQNVAEKNKKFYDYRYLRPMSSSRFRKHFMSLPEKFDYLIILVGILSEKVKLKSLLIVKKILW